MALTTVPCATPLAFDIDSEKVLDKLCLERINS
jgi:hypothetical protein